MLTGCSSTLVRGTAGCRRSAMTRAAFEECRHSNSCSSSSVTRHAESGQAPATTATTDETCWFCDCSSLCGKRDKESGQAPDHNTQKWLRPAACVVAHHLLSPGTVSQMGAVYGHCKSLHDHGRTLCCTHSIWTSLRQQDLGVLQGLHQSQQWLDVPVVCLLI